MSTIEVQKTITVKQRVCDFCGKIEDFKKVHMNTCDYCGKDVCNWCILEIPLNDPTAYIEYVYPCPECKDKDIRYLQKIREDLIKKEDGVL